MKFGKEVQKELRERGIEDLLERVHLEFEEIKRALEAGRIEFAKALAEEAYEYYQ